MASSPQVVKTIDEQSLSKDRYSKRAIAQCALEPSSLFSSKRVKLNEAPASCDQTFQEIEYQSADDETDQCAASISRAIGERLDTLQLLLPESSQMEDDELLRVLVEYVRELEGKIKMFNTTTDRWTEIEEIAADESPLQRKGLCIVPLSSLAKDL
ncbi:hypothetical protein KP509_22G070000 [Ceratopteris richardii]|uniref:Uncharacterized protein n=1 Tax=Ceratopteris richardii TaxID=49495 RepID=A0A8T2S927_CERRI|nr:hypothetical protein KP509_22G070000 [Ceratopteris richardii]